MNVTEKYIEIILDAIKRNSKPGPGFEEHHIIPKCVNKNLIKEKSNLVTLTYKEHYEAHKELAKANPKNKRLQRAWTLMGTIGKTQITADEYEILKTLARKLNSGINNPNYKHGKTITKEDLKNYLKDWRKENGKESYNRWYQNNKNKIKEKKENQTEEQKQHIKEYQKEYKITHKQNKEPQKRGRKPLSEEEKKNRIKERNKNYYQKNKDKIKENAKEYKEHLTEEQKAHIKEYQKKYRKEHKK